MNTEVFSYKPFQKSGSHELMHACKTNNHILVSEIIKDNRFLVYDFDFVFKHYQNRFNSQRCIGLVREVT
jgi:hypothetical protein